MNKEGDCNKESDDYVNEVKTAFLWVSGALSIACCMISLAIIVIQVWGYLVNDVWQPISIISMLLHFKVEWAMSPASFVWVYKILDFIPLSLLFLVLALIQYLSGLVFMKKLMEALQAYQAQKK